MRRFLLVALSLTLLAGSTYFGGGYGCATSKDIVSGKSVINYYKLEDEIALGKLAYELQLSLVRSANVPIDSPIDKEEIERVKRIGERIFPVTHYPNFPYEIRIIRDDSTNNATTLPAGKIFIYTGLWRPGDGLVEKGNDDQLAAVIAHEAAHSNARHHTELQSKAIATSIWVGALTGIFAGTKYEAINNLFIITGSLMVPKFSRDNEYEADKLALIYMARAGYDPNEAIRLWEKAASRYDKNNKTNAFASHPPEWRRAERLKKHLPEAIAYYEDAKRGVTPATYTLHASMRSGSYVVKSNTCSIALNNLKVESEKDYHAAKMASLRTDMQSQSKKSLKAEIQKEYVLLKRDVPSPTRFVMRDADSQEVKLFVTVKSDGSLIATDNRSKPKYICEGRLADGKRGNMGVLKCEDASPDTTAKHIVPMPAKGKQSRASGPSYSCRITLVGQ